MAKKQTFGDKINKNDNKNICIKLIRSKISDKTGAIRFYEDIIAIPEGISPENIIKEFIQSK